MTWNILDIAHSGLNAAQVGVSVTGNNIANAGTDGYNRQVAVQVETGTSQGSHYISMGTDVADVRRIYSDVLSSQMRATQSNQSGLDTYQTQIAPLDSLLSDNSSGLASGLQGFQAGLKGLAANPSDPGYRQSALSSARSLVDRFHSLGSQLGQTAQSVNNQITESVTSINSLAKQIAEANNAISSAIGNSTDQTSPNNLMDHRDQLLLTLSKQVNIEVSRQGNTVNVSMARGEPLVMGSDTFELKTLSSPEDPSQVAVGQTKNGYTVAFDENNLNGGVLGGLVQFRSQTLKPAQNALGQIAIGLAADFNAQNQLGLDANGSLGKALMSTTSPQVNSNANNLGSGLLAAAISDTHALTTSDYQVQYDGTNYKITRLADGSVLSNANTLPSSPIDGLSFSLSSGQPAAGDEFLIRPTVNGASSLSLLTNNPADLAAAAPVRTAAGTANTGTAKISAGTVDASYLAAPLTTGQSVAFSYSAASQSFTVTPGANVTVTVGGVATLYNADPLTGTTTVPYTSGATISTGGMSMSISGTPADLDSFSILPNTGASGDGRNANLLAGLQMGKTLQGGTLGYQDANAHLVSGVGNKASEVTANNQFATALLTTISTNQQSQSGVNFDEEAANLLKYQQAYQASAKVITVANQMFDVLFSIAR